MALPRLPSAGISAAVDQAPPQQWYDGIDTIKVFSPGDSLEKFALDVYNDTSGCDKTGEFSTVRLAMLLRPGTYSDRIAVGYYTSLVGVGAFGRLCCGPVLLHDEQELWRGRKSAWVLRWTLRRWSDQLLALGGGSGHY